MECEVCGGSMQWRCTDRITNQSKFKCCHCGHIMLTKAVPDKSTNSKFVPKHYYVNNLNGCYKVQKIKGKTYTYYGQYPQEEVAKLVVNELKKCDWDKSMLPGIYDRLGLVRVNRRWVKA